MSTTTMFQTIKNSQKVRVIMHGVGVNLMVKDVRKTFFPSNLGLAVESVLFSLSESRRKAIRENQEILPTDMFMRINFAEVDLDIHVALV